MLVTLQREGLYNFSFSGSVSGSQLVFLLYKMSSYRIIDVNQKLYYVAIDHLSSLKNSLIYVTVLPSM
jgi:hypothetical protein